MWYKWKKKENSRHNHCEYYTRNNLCSGTKPLYKLKFNGNILGRKRPHGKWKKPLTFLTISISELKGHNKDDTRDGVLLKVVGCNIQIPTLLFYALETFETFFNY